MSAALEFRLAAAADAADAVALIRDSGPLAIDYGFGARAPGFLAAAFVDGRGLFGWRNHTVAVLDGQIAGIAAGYGLARHLRLNAEHALQMLKWYGLAHFVPVLVRNLHLRTLMPAPESGEHYVAHVAVRADLQRRGIGRAIIEHQIACARRLGRRRLALDVALSNSPARALYERCGLRAGAVHVFAGPAGRVPETQRMTIDL